MKEALDQTGAKPTHLEAASALRASIIKKHACAGHVFDHRAIARREQLTHERSQQGAETETEAATAFNRIGLAQARQQSAARQASAAEQAAEAARETEAAARLAREAAELQAKALRAAADALKPKEPSHKKQKTAFSAGSSSQQVQQTDENVILSNCWYSELYSCVQDHLYVCTVASRHSSSVQKGVIM